MSSSEIVLVDGLVKEYPGGIVAVAGIDFAVARGEFFGFLGPNGAGKSTTMKVLSTLLKKTSGRVVVDGHDVDRDATAVRKTIGFAMQEVGLDDLAAGRDFLVLQGVLYGLKRADARRRADELLALVELVELTAVAGRKVGTYSGGMRRRIDLVGALMHSPPLLFLDEPTSGLDPQSRMAIWDHLEDLNAQGVTIFLTTQMMEEAERLCQRLAIIDRGRIVAEGSPRALKSEVGGDVVRVDLDGVDGDPANAEKAATIARQRTYVESVTASDGSLSIQVEDGSAAAPDLLRVFNENNLPVTNLAIASPTLDEVFLKHTGRTIRAEDAEGDAAAQAMRAWVGLSKR